MKKITLTILALFLAFSAANATDGFALLTRSKDKKLTLEIPDSLLGRKVMLHSRVVSSETKTAPVFADVSKDYIYRITKVDSSIVFTLCAEPVFCSDTNISKALGTSRTDAVNLLFRIKKRTQDGTASQIDATKLFDPASKSNINLKGRDWNGFTIREFNYQADRSNFEAIECFNRSIGVRTECTFDLKVNTKLMVHELETPFPFTFTVLTTLTLLNGSNMPHKTADKRIGAFTTSYSELDAAKGSRSDNMAIRWDLRAPITIHIDTLFTPAMQQAIREGLEQWNLALEKAGVGRKIEPMLYGEAPGFRSDDPTLNTISRAGNGMSPSYTLLSNGADQLLSMRVCIPSNYVQSVRRRSVYAISDVDERYNCYNLSEDAVCDVLKADILRIMGICLGIKQNYAGSAAYSPAQITNPEFTREHGFTASVTDDVLFNYFAKPGDKQRGLATIIDRAGEYDIYALRWLYADGQVDLNCTPEHFFSDLSSDNPDPRARRYDLSNDVEAAFDAEMTHLKFLADHSHEWLKDDDIPQDYRELFVDWIWLNGSNMAYLLASTVGAYKVNIPYESSKTVKYEALDKNLQKRCLSKAFDFYRNQAWIDNTEVLKLAGPNRNATDMSRVNAFKMVNSSFRFPFVAKAAEWAGSDYSVHEYLGDLESEVFGKVRGGKFQMGDMHIIAQYIYMLSGYDSLASSEPIQGMSEECHLYLDRAQKELKSLRRSMKSRTDKGQADFLLYFLEQKKK